MVLVMTVASDDVVMVVKKYVVVMVEGDGLIDVVGMVVVVVSKDVCNLVVKFVADVVVVKGWRQ